MEWTLPELNHELRSDPDRRILFVEGDHDLGFWRTLVPISERGNTTIYKIGSVNYFVEEGGERGRIIAVAREFEASEFNERVAFFADADTDRILSRAVPSNVTLTDVRDRESYANNNRCVSAICKTGFNKNDAFLEETLNLKSSLLRPIAIMRLTSDRSDLKLPFQRTFNYVCGENSTIRRYWMRSGRSFTVDIQRITSALLQNCGRSLNERGALIESISAERDRMGDIPDDQIVHGKDFVAFISWRFDCSQAISETIVNLAMTGTMDDIRVHPNISRTENWVRNASLEAP